LFLLHHSDFGSPARKGFQCSAVVDIVQPQVAVSALCYPCDDRTCTDGLFPVFVMLVVSDVDSTPANGLSGAFAGQHDLRSAFSLWQLLAVLTRESAA
jgi:hypothetical protein